MMIRECPALSSNAYRALCVVSVETAEDLASHKTKGTVPY